MAVLLCVLSYCHVFSKVAVHRTFSSTSHKRKVGTWQQSWLRQDGHRAVDNGLVLYCKTSHRHYSNGILFATRSRKKGKYILKTENDWMDIWFSANLKNNRSTDSSLFKKYFCVIYFKYFVCFCDLYNFLATIFSVFVDFFPPWPDHDISLPVYSTPWHVERLPGEDLVGLKCIKFSLFPTNPYMNICDL